MYANYCLVIKFLKCTLDMMIPVSNPAPGMQRLKDLSEFKASLAYIGTFSLSELNNETLCETRPPTNENTAYDDN